MCDHCTSAAPTKNMRVLTEAGSMWVALCAACSAKLFWWTAPGEPEANLHERSA